MATLYRKYRPQTFEGLIGQNHIKITLEHEVELGQIGHAYLFTGPRGLGKTSTARIFTKSINCLDRKDGQSEPCNKCSSCQAIISNSAVDIIEIDAASHTGVDKVRENIIENIRFTPTSSKYKVFIIDEVHMLSIPAFNALLKTLEEPPTHTVFILCTTEIHKVPQTIISRCQRFDFKKVTKKEMMKRLEYIVKAEGKRVDEKVLENIVIYSEGCIRDAESLLGKVLILGDDVTMEQAEIILPRSDFGSIISFLNFLLDKNSTAAIELINKLVNEGVDLQIFVDNLIEFLRKVLLIKVNSSLAEFGVELDEEIEKSLEGLANRFDYSNLISMIELFFEKRQEIKNSFISQFPIEMAIIQITEEVVCNRDDDFNDHSSNGSGSSVKEKIKDKLSHLAPRKEKIEMVHLDIEKKEKNKTEIKVDLLSNDDKLKTKCKINFKKIKENWPNIVRGLLKENYTLSSLLKISEPIKCDGNELEIGVKSNFYKSRLETTNNKQIVEKVISEVVVADVKIRGLVKQDLEPIDIDVSDLIVSEAEEGSETTQVVKQETKPESKPIEIKIEKSQDVVQDVVSMF